MTLEQIIKSEKKVRHEKGDFGIASCKYSIKTQIEVDAIYGIHSTLYTKLEEYVKRANEDVFFNKAMVLACWELINEEII